MNQVASIPSRGAVHLRNSSNTVRHWGALLGGAALAFYGLSRRSPFGALVAGSGGGLAYYAYRAGSSTDQELTARSSVLLNCSPENAFRFWRDFQNLPRFMAHLQSVTVTDAKHSRWTIRGPLARPVTLNSEIFSERENEFIAWRSLPGSDLMAEGSVEFRPAAEGRGTVLEATVSYSLPAGKLGHPLAKVLGKDPSFLMRQDLRRLKALIETGEIPTIEGQSHGPRTLFTGFARVFNPDVPVRRDISIGQAVNEQRRVS